MRRIFVTSVLIASLLGVSACSGMSTRAQRTLSGGAIGAAGGAALTAVVGGPVLVGALAGGAAGALVGNVTTSREVSVGH